MWSPKFAYAIGLFVADGCVLSDGRHIDFTSKDLLQVEKFCLCLDIKTRISLKFSGAGLAYHRVQFSDVLFRNFLAEIGIGPAKSKVIASVQVPRKYFEHFLRGYFDGDGCSYSFYDSVFPNSYRFYISFMSASPTFLQWLQKRIIENVGVKGHFSRHIKKEHIQLKFAKKEALALAAYMYKNKRNYYLARKYLKVRETVRIISRRRGGEIGKHASFRS